MQAQTSRMFVQSKIQVIHACVLSHKQSVLCMQVHEIYNSQHPTQVNVNASDTSFACNMLPFVLSGHVVHVRQKTYTKHSTPWQLKHAACKAIIRRSLDNYAGDAQVVAVITVSAGGSLL